MDTTVTEDRTASFLRVEVTYNPEDAASTTSVSLLIL
jgi:hypothetical protein